MRAAIIFEPIYLFILALLVIFKENYAYNFNLNLRPRQFINEGAIQTFRSTIASKLLESFILIQQASDDDTIIIGARDALFNLSSETLESKYIINWKALGQTIEECHMKGKSESECHNYVRVATRLRNGRLLVCGTHAFSPLCKEYDLLLDENRFVEREQYSGQAISPYDPLYNSTFVYDNNNNEIFVGTVSDISANDALLYRKRMHTTNGGEVLRTPKDDRVIDAPQFVGSFLYKDYVYYWYREHAVESSDNNRESVVYSRVGRICAHDNGGPPPANDRFATFLKARLNCSISSNKKFGSSSAPFYFNELQSLSRPVNDGNGDMLVFGVFHTSHSLLMSAVCAFRISQIAAIFDHGRFKTQRTPTSLWMPFQTFYSSSAERPGRCVPDTRRLADVSFITKNPLMYDLVPSEGHRPLLVEGPDRPAITSINALPNRVNAVRNQLHYVIYVGRADGTIGKYVDTSVDHEGVLVENVRVFNITQSISSLYTISSIHKQVLIAVTNNEVARLPLHHCSLAHTCMQCVQLRDPHCAWNVNSLQCQNTNDWSTGSYIQNILKGASEQCPDFGSYTNNALDSLFFIGEEIPQNSASSERHNNNNGTQISEKNFQKEIHSDKLFSTANLSVIGLIIVLSSVFGFLIGYRISKWRMLNIMSRRPAASGVSSSGGSSASDEYEQFGPSNSRNARLSRHNSFSVNPMLIAKSGNFMNAVPTENYYVAPHAGKLSVGSMAATVADTGAFIPLQMTTSMSNAGSGAVTPRHETRSTLLGSSVIAGGTTLPRDYKVKKVYL